MNWTIGNLQWRNLELSDIPGLSDFAPSDWGMALDVMLLQHFGRSYFHGRVASTAAGIIAVGQGIATGRTGWVGNVIVRPEARNQGIGSQMTRDIMTLLRGRGCSSLLLVATALGEPVYRKLGYRTTADYVFLDVPRLPPCPPTTVRRLADSDVPAALDLDALATGESRAGLLTPHLASGWAHTGHDGGLDGFFLPSLGRGLVIAGDPAAGLELLSLRHAFFPAGVVVPAMNTTALQFLAAHRARETARAPRMIIGDGAPWRPELIFARAAGYCG